MVTRVNSGGILDGSVSTDKIIDNSVTSNKIADGSVTSAKLSSTAVADKLGYTPQVPLVSGTNIKTVGGVSILGSGNITAGTTVAVVSGTTQAAVAGTHYVLTNAATTTVTLPSSAVSGDVVAITVRNGLYTNSILNNGLRIMDLLESLIINQNNASFSLVYADATRGWVLT
jgi:hypothetical protein